MKNHINYAILISFFVISIFIAFNRDFSLVMQSKFKMNQRWVLSKITSSVFGHDAIYEILKIRDKNTINLEVYKMLPTGSSRFVNKIPLNQEFDGHFLFNNITANLALNDLDRDGTPEILAPTFDHSMTPHLNVVKYNPEDQSFFLVLNSLESY